MTASTTISIRELPNGLLPYADDIAEWEAEAGLRRSPTRPLTGLYDQSPARADGELPGDRAADQRRHRLDDLGQCVSGTLAIAGRRHQPLYGLCRHPALSKRHRRSDDDSIRHLHHSACRARFFSFWLAERSDVMATGTAPRLSHRSCRSATSSSSSPYRAIHTPPSLVTGEYRIVTLFTRTGQITTNDDAEFDNPLNPANGSTYNPGYPFLAAAQGP